MTDPNHPPLALGGAPTPVKIGSRTSGELTSQQTRVTVVAAEVEIDPTKYAIPNGGDAAWGMDLDN